MDQQQTGGTGALSFWDEPTKCPVMSTVRLVGRTVRSVRRLSSEGHQPVRAFTLVELLVVMGVISVLISLLLPALHRARAQSDAVVCASNLRSMGQALLIYTNDHGNRLPYIIEPLWEPIRRLNFTKNSFSEPQSLANTLKTVWKGDPSKVLKCSSALLGYPNDSYAMTYRVSGANNYDGIPMTMEQLVLPNGSVRYEYSLKQLNGRKYKMLHMDGSMFPFKLAKGPGPFYLIRDFVGKKPDPNDFSPLLPHNKTFNQLMLDMSVNNERDTTVGLSYP